MDYNNDIEYQKIIKDILNNQKFMKLNNDRHHGITRLEHSLKVSYNSYKIAKKLNLNYVETARGGLLHDFFINSDLHGFKRRFSMFFHPFKSIENASKYFKLTNLERDIIINHMFPTLPLKIPKHLESWIVSLVDKKIATEEFYCSYGKSKLYKLSNAISLLLIFKK